MQDRHYIPIWLFIGALLFVYGILIFGAGLYQLFVPPTEHTVLAELHAGVWWGALLIAIGAFYCYRHRPGRKS